MTCRMQFKINPVDRKSLAPTYTAGIDGSKSFFNDGQIVVVGDVFLMSVSRVIGMACEIMAWSTGLHGSR